MTEDRLPLAELLQKAGKGDFLRSVAEAVLQLLMEADAEGLIGTGRHERSSDDRGPPEPRGEPCAEIDRRHQSGPDPPAGWDAAAPFARDQPPDRLSP